MGAPQCARAGLTAEEIPWVFLSSVAHRSQHDADLVGLGAALHTENRAGSSAGHTRPDLGGTVRSLRYSRSACSHRVRNRHHLQASRYAIRSVRLPARSAEPHCAIHTWSSSGAGPLSRRRSTCGSRIALRSPGKGSRSLASGFCSRAMWVHAAGRRRRNILMTSSSGDRFCRRRRMAASNAARRGRRRTTKRYFL
jgi:hypothetical protein